MRVALVVLALIATGVAQSSNCAGTSAGLQPLTDPNFNLYKGYPGGLYPNGANQRPAAHQAAGLQQAARVQPLNAQGAPDAANGKIALISIGMSNTTMEFSTFKTLADPDPAKNPKLSIVDCAVGGMTAHAILTPPTSTQYWTTVEQRLQAAGISDAQVQAVWLKEADADPTTGFPAYAQSVQSELQTVLQMLRSSYPNLCLVYLASRIYAGYASSPLNPEPYAYESGFTVKWLIEQQISGNPDLSYTAGKVPWLSWGPYLWADGMNPRIGDGLTWACSDFQTADGTHPSPEGGQPKVANMLLNFFKTDTTTASWFTNKPAALPQRSLGRRPRK
jgi:hypothetical protein